MPKSGPLSDPDDTDLPVPVESRRTYLRVRPTDEPLGPDTVQTHFRRLHQLDGGTRGGFLDNLRDRSSPRPTVECLLVSDGGVDAPISYAFGIDDAAMVAALERVLRGLFPDSYEIRRTTEPRERLDSLFDTTANRISAVEFRGHAERRADWQTRLTPFDAFYEDDQNQHRVPLAAVIEAMAESEVPLVYQALLRPKPDWSARAESRRVAIETNQDTLGGQLGNVVFGPPDEDVSLPAPDQTRLDELAARDARRSFVVNARIAAVDRNGDEEGAGVAATEGGEATRTVRQLASTFADVSHTCYEIAGTVSTGTAGRAISEAMRERTFHPPSYERLRTRLPWTQNASPGIVADAAEAPSFCLLGGGTLTAAGARAVAPTPGERTALPRPPFEQLTNYRGEGLLLGTPLTQDGTPDDEPLVLPPPLQPLHVAWFGKTGSGKSTSLINAMLANHAATAGATILIDPKGDGMPVDYLRAHDATNDTLDNVLYFDCAEVLPAFSFFDIRAELDAGVPRTTAVEDTVDHYVEILTQIMGAERFGQAVRSPDVIRYLTKAMFDPVNGDDAFSHRDLHEAVRRMHERQSAPAVSDDDLERMLAGVVANRARSFDEIMQGVANRLEKIPVDRRLARIFNHVPEERDRSADGTGDPHFDLADYLNEDVVIVFDTGDLRTEAQRVLTLVILSNLWTALRRRTRRSPSDAHPLVNLYVEEAASVAVSDLLKELLAQSRSFGCAVTLAMQFPAQLRSHGETAYSEVLNNVSTFVTGNVPVDRRLAERLATDEMDARSVGNRLRALRRGQWLVSLPAAFDEPEPRPFLVGSVAPPPGDPAGDRPLSTADERAFEKRMDRVRDRTRGESGLTLGLPSTATQRDDAETAEADASTQQHQQQQQRLRVDSALPHTKRLPPAVEYDASIHALRCVTCDNRYDPTVEGMRRAIACCSSLAETERDDIPICDLNLKLTPEERAAAAYSETQLMFLQAVYNAQQLRYSEIEYDLLHDSMIRLQEYVGIESGAIQDLIDADLLRHDADHPHRLYTVTPAGRDEIGESYRLGIDYGHGAGDLEESSQHVLAVEVARRYLECEYAADPDSAVVEVVPYYDLDDDETLSAAAYMGGEHDAQSAASSYERRRLDVAGLDADGGIEVAVEAERVNNDVRRAVPDDFDKIADCDVEEAIWVVMTQAAGHEVLAALNDPPEGEPRVEKTYAATTPPQQFRIETPGLTAMYPAEWLRDRLEE